jgi:hypothetical protein
MTHYRLHSLSRIPHRIALVALALAGLSACVVTQSPEPTTPPPPPSEYPPEASHPPEPAPYPSVPYRNPGPSGRRPLPHHPRPGRPHHQPPPAADCSERPSFACCKALTPECNACMDNARAAQEQWDRECASAGPVPEPSKPPVDCNEAPGGMCCEANTAECNSCRRAAAAERAAWARECHAEAPPALPPSQPVVDCTEAPSRMCCQAEIPACHSCKREAAAERAAWERQCL